MPTGCKAQPFEHASTRPCCRASLSPLSPNALSRDGESTGNGKTPSFALFHSQRGHRDHGQSRDEENHHYDEQQLHALAGAFEFAPQQ